MQGRRWGVGGVGGTCAVSSLYVKPQILFNNILEEVLRERPGKEGSGIYKPAPPMAHHTDTGLTAKSTIITLPRARPAARQTQEPCYLLKARAVRGRGTRGSQGWPAILSRAGT